LNKVLITYILLVIAGFSFAQERAGKSGIIPDTIVSEIIPESIIDTLPPDSLLVADTTRIDSIMPQSIEAPINYNAKDSIIISVDGQRVYLYNSATVTYQETELNADYIELNLETKEVYAEGRPDTAGVMQGTPVFKDGKEEFESKTLRYNFDTKKGIITDVKTAQGEGFVLSERTKKISEDAFILKKGKYTTCDAEHPHFYLHLTKAKVISNKKIITGPAWMVLEDFPIYFPVIPFGYFPNSERYSSGIMIPTYGEEANRGFFLQDGGYYWAANQYFDLAVTGDIYSKGSWATKLHTNYRKLYKFSGSFDFKYNVNIYGEKGLDTYSKSNQFAVTWSHSQDAKANPSRTFSASVNFSTSGYDKQNSTITSETYLQTQKSSSISYSKKWENTPFNLSANLRHSQNSTDTTISLSLPELQFSMSKIYPFKRSKRSGPVRWYEKFGLSYTGNFRNSITSKESELLHKPFSEWSNGIKHSIPISLPNFNLGNINVSPSFSYGEKWYFKSLEKNYYAGNTFIDDSGDESHIKTDTINGFNRVYQYAYSLSASTNIYGNFMPLNPKSKIKGIRHKMTPSLSFSYTPDFGVKRFGFWKQVQTDSTGKMEYYDRFAGGIYGGSPSRGASGSINFSVSNNLEMKMKNSGKDTADAKEAYKKVKLIDDFGFSGSYDLIRDSLNLSTISVRGRTTIKGVSINLGGVVDPLMSDSLGNRIQKYAWTNTTGLAKIGRLTRANLSFGMSFKSKKGEKEAAANKAAIEEQKILPGEYDDYVDFNIPWEFRFDYSFNYSRPNPFVKGSFTQTLSFNGSASITDKWRISMNTNYDIMAGEFSYTTFNVTRDLHCWDMSFNFVPFGYMKSYSFQINARSSMLKDLKLTKRQSHYDNF